MKKKITALLFIAFWMTGPAWAEADIKKGRTFFHKKCSPCHKITEQNGTGPGLKDVTKRREMKWIAKWLESPRKMIAAGDPVARALYKKYKIKMPTIFEFRKEEGLLEDVLEYLKTL